ncbi:type I polyketide synthase [Mycobacterium lacus]|uniref:Putative polyketide synthase n=1 Tax=Mycobacterium lacus TaxID=169765 RepID=A0A1X1XMP9_9MYCO|nr:type I polyketide synthase [Mycobacterium lacus]MCV7123052.1 acyltransferase domain-containing protein [Mycobacterium lacus]ORW00126.1 polyketide synthase [Mycobacterium lacus]BBX96242.1 putative polyketide synthase [Mycobacterium lacus]
MIPIAVVGIDCRFPGARDKDAFWRLLMDGVVTDAEVPSQRWDIDTYYHPDGAAGSMNTRRAHFIDDVDAFDNEFFGIAPVEAAALDPQQRLLLQTAWRALEDAGIDPRSLAGTPTGVFVGMMSSEWGFRQILDFKGLTVFRGTGSGYFMTANRISYHLNLTGPSMAIDSACSSSLMAVHQGCVALGSGETDTVIAAGANLLLTPGLSIFYTQAGLSAPDGRCKPFGKCADGIGRGEGVAAVVLRRLDDAVADGQPIYAVVKSSVANHDGRSNGITAPNRRSQVNLMRRALDLAELEPAQLNFVEAHGTGTSLGDMIEANALGDIHKTRDSAPCLLGSVKGNIGHTEGSAGIASFIKACLALHHSMLPPTVFGDTPNPRLRLDAHGLRLADGPQALPAGGALGAVSSFGLGGSNAHAVLESAPSAAAPHPGATGVLTLSAPSEQALRRNAASVAAVLQTVDPQRLAPWCRATNVVKRSHRFRLALEGNHGTLVEGLREFLAGARADLASSAPMRQVPAAVGLLCSGQGTQYPGMTRPLYDANPRYREHLDAVTAAFDPHLSSELRSVMFGDDPGLDHASLAQPALFAVSYALGKTLLQTGIRPAFGIGHSVGEVAAACLAGVLSLEDAAGLIAIRGRLIGSLPAGGAMIAVDLGVEHAVALVAGEPDCAIAAVNGPRSLVISGAADAVARAYAAVREQGGKALYLSVSHGFHSPLMEPIVAEFRRELSWLTPGRAQFPLFSTVLGKQVAGPELDSDYWANQICSPVRFFDAVVAAGSAARADCVAEAGPRPTLLALAMQCGLPSQTRSLPLCTGPNSDGTELLVVAASMLRDGYSPDLTPLYGRPAGRLPRIPPYVFNTAHRFWFEGGVGAVAPPTPSATVIPVGERERPEPVPPSRESELLAIIADVGGYPVARLGWSSRLAEDLGYDSLLQLRLIERLRAEYPQLGHIGVPEVLSKIRSVGDLVEFLARWFDTAGVAG